MSIKPMAILMKVTQMKNTPDYSDLIAALEKDVVDLHACVDFSRRQLRECQQALKIWRMRRRSRVFWRGRRSRLSNCRIARRIYRDCVARLLRSEHRLANLRCDEPLPF
ncbi:hypothetical protein ACE1BH_23835 [Aeromonas jandaei]